MRQVAGILEVCTATVYKLCAEGQLPHVRISGAVRISPADLQAFLAAHVRVGATPKPSQPKSGEQAPGTEVEEG